MSSPSAPSASSVAGCTALLPMFTQFLLVSPSAKVFPMVGFATVVTQRAIGWAFSRLMFQATIATRLTALKAILHTKNAFYRFFFHPTNRSQYNSCLSRVFYALINSNETIVYDKNTLARVAPTLVLMKHDEKKEISYKYLLCLVFFLKTFVVSNFFVLTSQFPKLVITRANAERGV